MVTLRQAERLVGLDYVPGHFDCMHLAVLAQRELFGRAVPWQARRHPTGTGLQAAWLRQHAADLAVPVAPTEAVAGDAVLWTRQEAGGVQGWHIGTLFFGAGERWVLHTSQALGASVLQRLVDCAAQGLRLDGFYRWTV